MIGSPARNASSVQALHTLLIYYMKNCSETIFPSLTS
jgi:hypothetical protein